MKLQRHHAFTHGGPTELGVGGQGSGQHSGGTSPTGAPPSRRSPMQACDSLLSQLLSPFWHMSESMLLVVLSLLAFLLICITAQMRSMVGDDGSGTHSHIMARIMAFPPDIALDMTATGLRHPVLSEFGAQGRPGPPQVPAAVHQLSPSSTSAAAAAATNEPANFSATQAAPGTEAEGTLRHGSSNSSSSHAGSSTGISSNGSSEAATAGVTLPALADSTSRSSASTRASDGGSSSTSSASATAAARSSPSTVLSPPVLPAGAPRAPPWPSPRTQPYVIAHRGASGELPEHTVAAYQRAIELGADFIECDVVLTRDLHPVCRHEPDVNATTDAHVVFPHLARTLRIDGKDTTGIFVSDMTLAQVRQLRAVQVWPFRNQSYNGCFAVPTLSEYLDVAQAANRTVGVYIETKHPSWHNALPALKAAGVTIESVLLSELERRGYRGVANSAEWRARPAFLQSFEVTSLQAMAKHTCLPMLLLVDTQGNVAWDTGLSLDEVTAHDYLRNVSAFLSGYGPAKQSLLAWNAPTKKYLSTGIVERLHQYSLQVHPYTLRDEAQFVLPHVADAVAEDALLMATLGVDGGFTDHTRTLATYLTSASRQGQVWNTTTLNHIRPCRLPAAASAGVLTATRGTDVTVPDSVKATAQQQKSMA